MDKDTIQKAFDDHPLGWLEKFMFNHFSSTRTSLGLAHGVFITLLIFFLGGFYFTVMGECLAAAVCGMGTLLVILLLAAFWFPAIIIHHIRLYRVAKQLGVKLSQLNDLQQT
jgi:hypothetical protein